MVIDSRRRFARGFGLLLVLLAAIAAWQLIHKANCQLTKDIDSYAYTHPQTLVAIAPGRRLNLFCLGSGSPTVIFESGLGGSSMDWRHVQGHVAHFTRACSYDRAGYGFSDAPTQSANAINIVGDLYSLVHQVDIERPVVMVAHSRGGQYSLLYTELHKSDVAGLVLVDPSFTNQGQMWKASVTPEQWNAERIKKAAVLDSAKDCYKQSLVKTLLSAIKAASEQLSLCLDNPPNNDPVVHAELNREWASPKFWATNISETENAAPDEGGLSTDDKEMPVEPPRFGSLPMMILTRWGAPTYWNLGHRALAAASTEGSNVTIRFSGHRIQDDQPGAVVDAISNVVERVRSHAQPK